MHSTYQNPVFEYRPSADQSSATPVRHPVVIVGAGLVGLSAAIDFKLKGIPVVVVDDDNTVSVGSRAVAHAKRTLEIWDRLGCSERMLAKGVRWSVGKVFHGEELLYQFNLRPETDHRMPAFINLQQYYVEQYLVEYCMEIGVELRWLNRLTELEQSPDGVEAKVETPDGPYQLRCDWLIAADGARSTVRRLLALEFKGQIFNDRFLIADVVMKADFPPERWFWFNPPFHPKQSALLHMQADNVWRIDLQLGRDVDPEEEKKPERVLPRLRAMLGEDAEFELEWVSVYTFQCRRLERFNHDRVLFIGDAAHQVSPFGGRGANSGVQDADNLAWKLKLVMDGKAPATLLDSYSAERVLAADENILNSTRATDFITPKNKSAKAFRDAVLSLAQEHTFARSLLNSGRLSVPACYTDSPLNTPDADHFDTSLCPGSACADAPVRVGQEDAWLLRFLGGEFVGLYYGNADQAPMALHRLKELEIPVRPLIVAPPGGNGDVIDTKKLVAGRYDCQLGSFYLIRPDQHVAARWRVFDPAQVDAAASRACGRI